MDKQPGIYIAESDTFLFTKMHYRKRLQLVLLRIFLFANYSAQSLSLCTISRRALLTNGIVAATVTAIGPPTLASPETFHSASYNKQEYTNSIVASRDTNISPKEVYDTLLTLQPTTKPSTSLRALDIGAGAGVSTQVLYEMGYRTIDALDWSGDAWEQNVVSCPPSVHFYELDDERFLRTVWNNMKYDAIAFNFAINRNKAEYFASALLNDDGILLAPINTQTDYWLKQVYTLMDHSGKTLWTANDVGAWSVQFQPDVTQDTCQGVWCSPYNGFKKLQY